MSKFFVITHKDIPWDLPFPHTEVGVEGYVPDKKSGIAASEIISKALDFETAFGALRAVPAITEELRNQSRSDTVFVGSYRLFLSQETNTDWLSPVLQENKIITPSELANDWRSLIATELPDGVDIMIPAPRLLPDTVLGQYSRVHHLDDLLLATGCAIRAGLLEPLSVPSMLSSNTLVPYGIFAAKRELRMDFNDRLWWCVQDFYKHHYKPRSGYQRRVIDFVFERINSMAIVQMVINKGLNCVSARNIWVSEDGKYLPSK